MPELPEVETVKKMLEPDLVGKTFSRPIIYVKRAISGPIETYQNGVEGRKVTSLSRRGKYLLIHLDNQTKLLFHLRMEGKLFVVKKAPEENHLSLYLPFQGEEGGLAFFDTRKFGISYLLKEEDEGPLSKLGPEPSEIKDPNYLYRKYKRSSLPIKELLLDQSIMAGLGNIYANEVLFASSLSPFLPGKKLKKEDCAVLLKNAQKILEEAIEFNGSTIRTYHPASGRDGSFQNFLKVYSHEGEECPRCHKAKIEKLFVGGRGTEYCPYCQHTGISLGITGKIASGKSLATKYFSQCGFVTFSCDEEVHKLYQEEKFLKELKKKFPYVFAIDEEKKQDLLKKDPAFLSLDQVWNEKGEEETAKKIALTYPSLFTSAIDKGVITKLLSASPSFRHHYESFVYAALKEKINDFLIANNGKNKALEIPLLFESHFDKLVTYKVGVETTRQVAHLKERGEKASRTSFNKLNSYDKHRHELDFILHTDGPKRELKKQVKELVKKLAER